jgi:hypothetical protein
MLTVPRRCCCGARRYTVQIGAEQVPRHLDCFDELANGVKGPWLDGWGGVVHRRFEAWFGKFRAIGGQVDIVMLDWENNSPYFSWVAQPNCAAALAEDPRWPKLREDLNALGSTYNVSFPAAPTQAEMKAWAGDRAGMRQWVWNDVVNSMVARTVNVSIVAPLTKLFPKLIINNFSHKHRSDPAVVPWWPYQFGDSATPPAGTGQHVGTHQGGAFYGPSNKTKVLLSADIVRVQSVDASPFNVLLAHAAVASDMVKAAPSVPVLPWLEPDTTSYGDAFATLDPIWSEHLFHLTLRFSARRFLWWRAGRDLPLSRGMAAASAALRELDSVMNNATGGAWGADYGKQQACEMSTIDSVTQKQVTWHDPLLLSGVLVDCPSKSPVEVWRVTFRCDVPARDDDDRTCAYPTHPGEWHIGGGLTTMPVPNGRPLHLPGGVTTGFWFSRSMKNDDASAFNARVANAPEDGIAPSSGVWNDFVLDDGTARPAPAPAAAEAEGATLKCSTPPRAVALPAELPAEVEAFLTTAKGKLDQMWAASKAAGGSAVIVYGDRILMTHAFGTTVPATAAGDDAEPRACPDTHTLEGFCSRGAKCIACVSDEFPGSHRRLSH